MPHYPFSFSSFSFPPLPPESYDPEEPFRSSLLYAYLECTAKCVLFFPLSSFFWTAEGVWRVKQKWSDIAME